MYSNLYAPWRSKYVQQEGVKEGACPFCYHLIANKDDKALGIIYKDDCCYIVMNRYPYTPGHILIIPHDHVEHLEDLHQDVWIHMNELAYHAVALIKDVMKAHGVNIGINLGRAAGAGIAEHLHLHLLPRWDRDTNFMTTIANERVYSSDFERIYLMMKEKSCHYF